MWDLKLSVTNGCQGILCTHYASPVAESAWGLAIDTKARHLYVGARNSIDVIDTEHCVKKPSLQADGLFTQLAMIPDSDSLVATDFEGNAAVVMSLVTGAVVDRFPVGSHPFGVAAGS